MNTDSLDPCTHCDLCCPSLLSLHTKTINYSVFVAADKGGKGRGGKGGVGSSAQWCGRVMEGAHDVLAKYMEKRGGQVGTSALIGCLVGRMHSLHCKSGKGLYMTGVNMCDGCVWQI